jgi:amidohydrolase
MDEINITVRGKGGHGAMPHQNIDPVLVTCHLIIALQQVVSRHANPTVPSVLSFGKVIADGAINIIPDTVFIQGTFRTLDEKWRNEAHALMKSMSDGIAKSMGASCEFEIVRGYPALVNDPALTHHARLFAEEYLGTNNVVEADIMMIAEDFAYYTMETAACFYLLGIGNKEKGITSSLHTPTLISMKKPLP